MIAEDYKYIEGKPSKQPIWGTEMAMIAMKKKGRYVKITITTSRFDPSPENKTGMLMGNRSVWEIDDDPMKAKITSVLKWTADDQNWYVKDGSPIGPDAHAIPARHRLVLANFLMLRWNKGKLRGRVDDGM